VNRRKESPDPKHKSDQIEMTVQAKLEGIQKENDALRAELLALMEAEVKVMTDIA
jgi:hypothetical protein